MNRTRTLVIAGALAATWVLLIGPASAGSNKQAHSGRVRRRAAGAKTLEREATGRPGLARSNATGGGHLRLRLAR